MIRTHRDIPNGKYPNIHVFQDLDGLWYVHDEYDLARYGHPDIEVALRMYFIQVDEHLKQWQIDGWYRGQSLDFINSCFRDWGWPERPERFDI